MAFDSNKHLSLTQNNHLVNTHRGSRNDIVPSENNLLPTAPDTNTMLQTSTNIFVFANGGIVGMIQSFTVSESRTINKLQAIGYEGVVQAVPANTNGGQLSVTRIALYESNLWNALGLTSNGKSYNPLGSRVYHTTTDDALGNDTFETGNEGSLLSSSKVFSTLRDQRVPLEIQVKTKAAGNIEQYYIETYVDCWLSSYSKSFSVGTITVAETATIQYADVY